MSHIAFVKHIFCQIIQQILWEHHRDDLSEDFTFARTQHIRARGATSNATESDYHAALRSIENILQTCGRELTEFGLPIPPTAPNQSAADNNYDMAQQLNFDRDALAARVARDILLLNPEQRAIYDSILADIYDTGPPRPRAHFMQAPGGSGKTFVLSLLLDTVRSRGDVALAVASTGVAALLMDGGTTAHFRFKIPILTTAESTCNISPSSNAGKVLAAAKLIVWDEAVTIHRFGHEAVSRLMRDIMGATNDQCENVIYGGKLIISYFLFRISKIAYRISHIAYRISHLHLITFNYLKYILFTL
jgi:hypothetical protein